MTKEPLFPLGQIVATPGALEKVDSIVLAQALSRHHRGDWGTICAEDRAENEFALKNDLRIMSVYEYPNQPKFWIISEADRSVTTFLLPEEY